MSKSIPLTTLPATPKKQFLNYIHNFRGLAILFVVAGHILLQWGNNPLTYRVFQVIWENGTVLFIFIAGYLFQHLSKNYTYTNYLIKKFQNVLVPYLIVSLPVLVYRIIYHDTPGYVLDVHPDFNNWTALKQAVYYILCGAHLLPLWFIPMIMLFYISAPLLIYIDRHAMLYYLLPVLIIVSLLIERRGTTDIFRMFIHFFSMYLFGMFMSRYKDRYIVFAKKYHVIIITVTIFIIIANLVFFSYNMHLNFLHKLFLCAVFIYILWRFDSYVPNFFGYLAKISFGIFFIHYYFVLLYRAITLKYFPVFFKGSIFSWVIAFAFVIFFCILTIEITRKIFSNKSRYIIGC